MVIFPWWHVIDPWTVFTVDFWTECMAVIEEFENISIVAKVNTVMATWLKLQKRLIKGLIQIPIALKGFLMSKAYVPNAEVGVANLFLSPLIANPLIFFESAKR
jgi:hypothetical protein